MAPCTRRTAPMSIRTLWSSLTAGLRGAVRLLSRPARADRGRGGIVIQTYRGYGTRREVFLMGRVFRQPGGGPRADAATLGRDLIDVVRRILRRGVRRAGLTARFAGGTERVTTDRDGYFRIRLCPAEPPPADRLWHTVTLTMAEPHGSKAGIGADTQAQVFIPPASARFVVISDIDDTVMYTGVANKLMMMWRLFVQGAASRTAFPGVAAFYRALHGGRSGAEQNPMLYVSRGPWSLYEVLEAFFQRHAIPVGPILFLREWGLTLQRPLPPQAKGHKLALVRDMLARYDDLPFVLIGDSGQHDPEMYAQVVREHPGRVRAIYIRNVTRDAGRRDAIDVLAEEVAAAGSALLLAADSFTMVGHAVDHGLIPPAALDAVLAERAAEAEEGAPGAPRAEPRAAVARPTPQATRAAVAAGAVDAALAQDTGDAAPPSVAVEPAGDEPQPRPPEPERCGHS